MNKLETINSIHRIGLGLRPSEADIAIVSIDQSGALGDLNQMVLREYNGGAQQVPSKIELRNKGYAISTINEKQILFVVTVSEKPTEENLETNLYNAILEYTKYFKNRKIWIPLMGTGAGGLSFEKSYEVTVSTINRILEKIQLNATFLFSIPDDNKGEVFFNKLRGPESLEEHSNIINYKDSKTFFVTSTNESVDSYYDFISEGYWRNSGINTQNSTIWSQVRSQDLFFLGRVFTSTDRNDYVRIRAIGIVSDYDKISNVFKVDWRVKDIDIQILSPEVRPYIISQLSSKDVRGIFSNLSNEQLEHLNGKINLPVQNSRKVAHLLSDSDKGEDYLDISNDVTAFARVIAARSFEPPLAIALFGKWGSGKSFFMRKLKERIKDYSDGNNTDVYCAGVVHIHFNAWSYMDANLWASFVIKIFEGLQEYIKNDNSTKEYKEGIRNELNKQLKITKAGIEILNEKKDAIDKQIKELKEKQREIKESVEKKIAELKERTLWSALNRIEKDFDVKQKIIKSLQKNESFIKTEAELRRILPEEFWNEPSVAYNFVTSKVAFLKEFFCKKNVVNNLLWGSLILGVIYLTPKILKDTGVIVGNIDFTIPQSYFAALVVLGGLWKRAEVVYKKIQPLAASLWKIKENYEDLKNKAISEFEQEENIIKVELERAKEEDFIYTQQLQRAESAFVEIEYKINNALSTESLYNFIDERSKSDDYKKHLGIISTIRKDFEILNGLFIDHQTDLVSQSTAENFRKLFSRPIERIVLYIDDLDRCSEENVVEVLEAVNLLMAFPLFVVVVGVDPRWVKNALIKKYSLQFAGKSNGDTGDLIGLEAIEPSNYLEKIFQIPFHLKEAKPESVRSMIKALAGSSAKHDSDVLKNIEGKEESNASNDKIEVNYDIFDYSSIVSETTKANSEATASVIESVELLVLTESEIEQLQEMGTFVGCNPRALKRFVNTYKIVKAHSDLSVDLIRSQDELFAIMFVLSLSIGDYKLLVNNFTQFLEAPRNSNEKISKYFDVSLGKNEFHKVNLKGEIERNKLLVKFLDLPVTLFKKHLSLIQRFTFKYS